MSGPEYARYGYRTVAIQVGLLLKSVQKGPSGGCWYDNNGQMTNLQYDRFRPRIFSEPSPFPTAEQTSKTYD